MSPPPAEVGGPQQGGLSLPLTGLEVGQMLSLVALFFRTLLILNGTSDRPFTCNMQYFPPVRFHSLLR